MLVSCRSSFALIWNAPLEDLADPMHTPNPAKAPWYFLGLQELLHYFPPVVAGVLMPGLVVMALIVIPYFNINIEAEGIFARQGSAFADLRRGSCRFWIFSSFFDVYVASGSRSFRPSSWRLHAAGGGYRPAERDGLPPLAGLQAAFLLDHDVVSVRADCAYAVGTFFRGPGWSWVLPWRS